VTIFHVSTRAW